MSNGEVTEGNLVGDIKHDQSAMNLDGSMTEPQREFLRKLEVLMVEYKVCKLDICFKPVWSTLQLDEPQSSDHVQ